MKSAGEREPPAGQRGEDGGDQQDALVAVHVAELGEERHDDGREQQLRRLEPVVARGLDVQVPDERRDQRDVVALQDAAGEFEQEQESDDEAMASTPAASAARRLGSQTSSISGLWRAGRMLGCVVPRVDCESRNFYGDESQALSELVDPGWAAALAPGQGEVARLGDFLRAETAAGRGYLPSGRQRAARLHLPVRGCPRPDRRTGPVSDSRASDRPVLRGRSRGAARAAQPAEHLQGAARRPRPSRCRRNGDLTPWVEARVHAAQPRAHGAPGESGSHRGIGWEAVTELAIRALVARGAPLVAILWGRDAGTLRPLLGNTPIIASAHPSPLSANSGFFGSRPFSRANELLVGMGAEPIDWALPA